MKRKNNMSFRRRTEVGQTKVFSYPGLPALQFEGLEACCFVDSEIIKPRLRDAHKAIDKGVPRLDGAQGVRAFCAILEGKTGVALENAAAELLLTSHPSGESDWALFTAWGARRAQPLDPKVIESFARFYVERLNESLRFAHRSSRPTGRPMPVAHRVAGL